MNKSYLGDGVYVEHDPDRGVLLLTAENGICVTAAIYLEPEVYQRLVDYVERLKARLREGGGDVAPDR